jgi:hypothetical protein
MTLTTCEIPTCEQPATHVQLIENAEGLAIPAEVCGPCAGTHRAGDKAIARTRAQLDQAGRDRPGWAGDHRPGG